MLSPAIFSAPSIHINQIGYELKGPKRAIYENSVSGSDLTFNLYNSNDEVVTSGSATFSGDVSGWKDRFFWSVDFSSIENAGDYYLEVDGNYSETFSIEENIIFNTTADAVVSAINSFRSKKDDSNVPIFDKPNKTVDLNGGWRDAAGDPGKHFSHLSYATYFNPQQAPMIAWSLCKAYERGKDRFKNSYALSAEAAYGADYLTTSLSHDGYFYNSVFDEWGWGDREVCKWGKDGVKSADYETGIREGGGLAIATLACASRQNLSGDYSSVEYLDAAKTAYDHLKINNENYLNNGIENILDEYCGLLASVELYKVTASQTYQEDADERAQNIINLQHNDGYFFSEKNSSRIFYHNVEEGLVILALIEYLSISDTYKSEVLNALTKWRQEILNLKNEVNNPFEYFRLRYSDNYDQSVTSFFMPQDNETSYWWQGENSRLASLSSAILMTERILGSESEEGYKSSIYQMDWILGLNPFDVCMVYGFGNNNYPDYPAEYGVPNSVGGVCNGITSGIDDENDLEFLHEHDSIDVWRWSEQWLTHAAWFLTAISIKDSLNNDPVANINGAKGSLSQCGLKLNISTNRKTLSYHLSKNIDASIKIFKANGRLVAKYQVEKRSGNISISSALSKGVYFTTLEQKGSKVVRQFSIAE